MSKVISDNKIYDTGHASMFSDKAAFQQNPDGTWSEAIPLPSFGLFRAKCGECYKKYRREDAYKEHYRLHHTDRKVYQRTQSGMVELKP
jgi:hypothetical protein